MQKRIQFQILIALAMLGLVVGACGAVAPEPTATVSPLPTNTPTATNTAKPEPTETPEPTATATKVPPTIFFSIEGDLIYRIEQVYPTMIATYNAENGTDYAFRSIIVHKDDLESGANIIELLDNGESTGYYILYSGHIDSVGWCVIACEEGEPASLMINNYAFFGDGSDEDAELRIVKEAPNARLGNNLGMIYVDSLDTLCYSWVFSITYFWGETNFKLSIYVDALLQEYLDDLGILHRPYSFMINGGFCPYYEE